MSVISVSERFQSRNVSFDPKGWKATRQFLVITDNYTDGPAVAAAATGIPCYNDLFPQKDVLPNYIAAMTGDTATDNSLRVQEIVANPYEGESDGACFLVDVTYRPRDNNNRTSEGSNNGSDASLPDTLISFDTRSYEIPAIYHFGMKTSVTPSGPRQVEETAMLEDKKNTTKGLICNSAGMLYDPPGTMSIFAVVFTIEMNRLEFDVAAAVAYNMTINKNPVTICGLFCPAGTARINSIKATPDYVSDKDTGKDTPYWKITMEIECRAYEQLFTAAETLAVRMSHNLSLLVLHPPVS